jgi:hypothetical protein
MLKLTLNYFNYFVESIFTIIRKAFSSRNNYVNFDHKNFSLLIRRKFYLAKHI